MLATRFRNADLHIGQATRMIIEPQSREQKLVDAMFAFFGDMTTEVDEEPQTQRICSHLLTLGEEVMGNHFTLSFIDLWNSEYPEEEEVTRHEVLWTLKIYDTSMTERTQEQVPLDANSTRPKLRVINGGLSAKPDRPYVAPDDIVHDLHTRRPDRTEKKPDRPKLRLIQGGMPARKVKRDLS